ncbi:MAG: LacI family DNA-binding transcriptional regulator [Candidatus Bipolaricaulota bacterium]
MATIGDVAREAGVSRAAVSLALNGKPGVAADTRRRVVETATRLGYQPNAQAKGLAMRKTSTLGVVVPDISSPFYSDLIWGIDEEAAVHGHYLMLCTTIGRPSRERRYLRLLGEQRVDGIIVLTPRGDEHSIRAIQDHGFPLVVVDRDIQVADDIVEVLVDNYHGAVAAVEHLLNTGHRQVAYINGIPELQASQERLRGYRTALGEHGIPYRSDLVEEGGFSEEGGARAMERLLAAEPQLEAVFAASDMMAIGAIHALRRAGLAVPNDVSVVGFDDVPLAAHFSPSLTTVRQPIAEMGRIALRLLLELLRGEAVWERKMLLQTQLAVRDSTCARR